MEKTSRETCLYNGVMVTKDHPAIEFRGCMDTLDAAFALAGAVARRQGDDEISRALWELQGFARRIMRQHALQKPMALLNLLGLSPKEIHEKSHNPPGGHLHMGQDTTELMAHVNLVRAEVRAAERAAARAFPDERDDIIDALNILSSAVYVLLCGMHARRGKNTSC